jgi:pimeloyl-ACP methyl ester carboxylesterase
MAPSAVIQASNVAVNGVSLHVEEFGQGDPLVLVHMGLSSSASWAGVTPLLAEHYHVVTFDSRGHGRSTNPGGTLRYEQLADDTMALIDALQLERPVVAGWSDGGEVALQFGLRHPGRARALIAGATSLELGSEKARAEMRAFFHTDSDGVVDYEAFIATIGQTLLPMMRQWHPNGEEHIRAIVQQSATMWLTYAGLSREQVGQITDPVLVAVGDRDEHVPVEGAERLYRELPNAELAILPGSTHLRPIFEPATFVAAATDFLQRH